MNPVTTFAKTLARLPQQAITSVAAADASMPRRVRLYRDVHQLDMVNQAGVSSQAYGLRWDDNLNPSW
jgi:hypothetical protein